MSDLDLQIRRTQRRLWLNRFCRGASLALGVAAATFAVTVLIQRLYDLPWPMLWIGVAVGAIALIATTIWTVLTREDEVCAAATLDGAAGLKERISSGRFCRDDKDPFARAVVADAERICGSIRAEQHVRFLVPQSLTFSALSFVAAALMFLITPGLLRGEELAKTQEQLVEVRQARVVAKQRMEQIRRLTEAMPGLEDLKEKFADLDGDAGGNLTRPDDIRHEAVKRIDKLSDAVKQKRQNNKYDLPGDTRRLMRRIRVPKSSDAPTQKLAKALSQGDFQSAKEEVRKIKELLATLKSEDDKELVAQISKQLEALSKQLQKLSVDKDLMQKLAQAGIKKEDLERMLQNLSKKDLDQIRKQLEKSGMTQQQIQKLTKQLQRKQSAGSVAKNLAKSLQQGAKGGNPGQSGDAMAGLSQAADQLSELEMLEQEMAQMDAALAEMDSAKSALGQPCSSCQGRGQGCSRCGGSGRQPRGGMGKNMASGRGGLASEEETGIGFKTQRGKVPTQSGAIIGQIFFEGEQVDGEISSELIRVRAADERQASDRTNRDRVPRQYQDAVRTYFSGVQRSLDAAERKKNGAQSPQDDGSS